MALFSGAKGGGMGLAFQIAAVGRPLISVTQLSDSGHDVKFGRYGGVITHLSSGRTLPLRREKGVYVLEMKIPKTEFAEHKKSNESEESAATGFTRPVVATP